MFSERQGLSVAAEDIISRNDESDELKGFLDQTLHTGERFVCNNYDCYFMSIIGTELPQTWVKVI